MRALLVVVPFGGIDRPSLGVHTLQAVARERGHTVDVLYANILFAARLGELPYMTVTEWGPSALLGERIMGLPLGAALPTSLLDALNGAINGTAKARSVKGATLSSEFITLATADWLADVDSAISGGAYDVIGFSTTFEQTNAVALLARHLRPLVPDTCLVVGGANCEGPMAAAIQRYIPEIDLVFSGESELAFADFLDSPERADGRRTINSMPNPDLKRLPTPDYSAFFEQLAASLPYSILRDNDDLHIPYESSRGCWWGQKHHCTFCGLNGSGIGYREKDPVRVRDDLVTLSAKCGIRKIDMTDNIMPHTYFSTLVPDLAKTAAGLDIFYEQKANISLDKVVGLKAAGISRIQPGIEALSDDLLKLMKKGTSGRQNVALLRYARATGIEIAWNMLCGFPDEQEDWYREILGWVPALFHLQPPGGVFGLSFDRFSPYFEEAAQFGVRDLRPTESYGEAFPGCGDLSALAYHFIGDSNALSFDTSQVLRDLRDAVDRWRAAWERELAPCLEVVELDAETYLMIDTRPLPGAVFMQQITAEQASVALSLHQTESKATRWGVQRSICLETRHGYMPLACAAPAVLQRFERVRAPDLMDAAV